MSHELRILTDPDAVASAGARFVAHAARQAAAAHGTFAMAVSGGRTPWLMFERLAGEDVPWPSVGMWQVDERIAPEGDEDRSLTHLLVSLPERARGVLRPMPVDDDELETASAAYGAALPPAFDLVHLGLGDDGHTASLVPGDPALDVRDRDVALTGEYRGRRRMTLTYRVLDRSVQVLWLVTGSDKAEPLRKLLASDPSIPAGRVAAARQVVLADRAAAGELRAHEDVGPGDD